MDFLIRDPLHPLLTVRAALGWLSALSVFLCKYVLYGTFCMGAQGA
jgi:hypothetical protein